jgi:Uma2 family endonuclease
MTAVPLTFVSHAEYLERERSAPTKSQYYRGEIFLMSGGTSAHSRIAANLMTALNLALAERPCLVYSSDMRIACPKGLTTYPDASALCGEEEFLDDRHDTLLNPQLIVEVLSPSTESFDRGKKFELYRTIPALREYILVTQDAPTIERFVRETATGNWTLSEYHGLEATLPIDILNCQVALKDVYRKIDFPPTPFTTPATI